MRRTPVLAVILVLFVAASGVWRDAEAQGNSELAGAWIVTSWETPEGEVNSEPHRGLYVFTESGHYSIMFVRGDEPRAEFADRQNPTDAEKLAAYDSITANSGRYSVEGDQLTYEAYVAKNPNYMAGFGPEGENAVTMTFTIVDGVLTLDFADGGKGTFRRPGGQ